jgi:cysteamine dioxygenase
MGSRLENLIRVAIQTFSNIKSASPINADSSIQTLSKLVNDITPVEDLGLSQSVGQPLSLNLPMPSVAPVTYMEVFENNAITVGVFILKQKSRIPLHDHPGMYGIIKVLYGSVNIQSYSVATTGSSNPSKFFAVKSPPTIVTERDGPVILSPLTNNIHEIWPVDGSSASFLDVLAPPYDPDGPDKRDCHYFRDDGFSGHLNLHALTEVKCPHSFWCDSLIFSKKKDIQHL